MSVGDGFPVPWNSQAHTGAGRETRPLRMLWEGNLSPTNDSVL